MFAMSLYDCQSGRFCVSGVEVLSYRIRLPRWETAEEISAFYGEAGARALAFCEDQLRAEAELAFSQSEDPQKRFRFPALRYHLEGRVTLEDPRRDLVSVLLLAELGRRGETAPVCRRLRAHTWRLSDGSLLPPRYALALWKSGARLLRPLRRDRELLLEDGRIFSVGGAEKRELFLVRERGEALFFGEKEPMEKNSGKSGKNM